MIVFMNLYRQGWYHRAGKPGTMRFHGGDLYPTREAAVADIDPAAPYIGTVPVTVSMASLPEVGMIEPYPAESSPIPLRVTRKEYEGGIDYQPDPAWAGRPIEMTGGAYAPRWDAIAAAEQEALS